MLIHRDMAAFALDHLVQRIEADRHYWKDAGGFVAAGANSDDSCQ
jgi:hypothetical protein